jgi:hypothetical protein
MPMTPYLRAIRSFDVPRKQSKLLATIGDGAHASWRASAVGVYRLWQDLGYAIGALLEGLVADLVGARDDGRGRSHP